MYVYNVTFEDGSVSEQRFDNPVVLSNNDTNTHSVCTSIVFVESVDVEVLDTAIMDPITVVEADVE